MLLIYLILPLWTRTTDFTDVTTISADTLFAPGVNAYAQVTIDNGVTATVSPAGTTFVNNGSGIIVDSIQQEGGAIKWKLPLLDGSDGTAIVTDGAGGFKVKGASAGGPATLNPQGETLLTTIDYNNYIADKNYVEFIVPTSLASSTSEIESFRIELDFLGFRANSGTQGSNTCIFLQPMSAAGIRIPLGTQSWNWLQVAQYATSSSFARQSIGSSGDSNEGTWSPSGGNYYGKDYGLAMTGPTSNHLTAASDYYNGPEQNFTSTDPLSQWRSGLTGQIKIYNQIYAPRFQFDLTGAMANDSSQWNYTGMTSNGYAAYREVQSVNYPITGEHARGYKIWFLPYNYSALGSWVISGGRMDVYVKLKQSKAEITVGDVA